MKLAPGGLSALRQVARDRFLRDSAWLTFALGVVNLSNYALNAALGQLLGRDRFGEVASLLALLFLFNIPTTSIQTLVVRDVSHAGSAQEVADAYAGVRRLVLPYAVGASVLALALTPLIVRFLHLDSLIAAALLAPLLGFSLLLPLYRGVLQGRRRFPALTVSIALEAAVRLFGSVLLVIIGLRSEGVLGAFGAGMIASLLLGRSLTHIERGNPDLDAERRRMRELLPVVLSIGLITMLFNLDVVLARHYQPGEIAGEYAAVSLTARVLFYLTSAVGQAVVASPALAEPRERAGLLAKGLGLVVGVALAGEIVYVVAAEPVLKLLFGSSYTAAAPALPVLGLGMTALAAANVLVYFLVAMRRSSQVGLLALSALVEAALIAWHHDTTLQMAVNFTTASLCALACLAVLSAMVIRKPVWRATA